MFYRSMKRQVCILNDRSIYNRRYRYSLMNYFEFNGFPMSSIGWADHKNANLFVALFIFIYINIA